MDPVETTTAVAAVPSRPPQRPPDRPPDHPPIITPSRLPGQSTTTQAQASNGVTAPATTPIPPDRPKSVMIRPGMPPPQSSTSSTSSTPSTAITTPTNSQPKLPPKVISKLPPKPAGVAPSPPTASPQYASGTQPATAQLPIAQPPTLQPKQPKQASSPASPASPRLASSNPIAPTTTVITPATPPSASPVVTPPNSTPIVTLTSPPNGNSAPSAPPPSAVVTPTTPPVANPTTTPVAAAPTPREQSPASTPANNATPLIIPTTTGSSPTTPTSPTNSTSPTSPTAPGSPGASSGGIQARIQAMSATGKEYPFKSRKTFETLFDNHTFRPPSVMMKPPIGGVPLPTPGGANPKVPAKPTKSSLNLSGGSSLHLAGGEGANGTNGSKFMNPRASQAIAPGDVDDGSHPVPPPKPVKPKFVDMHLASAQLQAQVSATLSVTEKKDASPAKLNPDLISGQSALNKALAQQPVAGQASQAGQAKPENKTLKRGALEKTAKEAVSDRLEIESKKVDDEKVFYTELQSLINKQSLAHGKSVDASQQLAQWIRDHGSRSSFATDDPVFGKCLMQASEVLRFTEVLRTQIILMWTNTVMAKSNEFMMNDMDETLAVKSRVESLKASLDATNIKLKNMTTKGKVNLVKLSDLRRERDALQAKYKEEKAKSLPSLLVTNHKHIHFMGSMCDTLSEYAKFFSQGEKIVGTVSSDLADYRVHITKMNDEFTKAQAEAEAAAAKAAEEDENEPRDEATFSDVLSKALIESEKVYQIQLDSISKGYLQVILSDGTLFSEIVKEDVTAIFGNVDVLADLQRKLGDTLLQDISNLTTESISRSFAGFTNALLDVYGQYIKNHNKAQDTLEQCKKKSKALCNTLKNCEAKDTSPERLELSALLALPLERVKQYEAYFHEIAKKETKELVKANISQVLECLAGLAAASAAATNQAKIKSILEVVNVNPDEAANEKSLAGVMGVISGEKEKPSLSPEETARWYSRHFIREGPLLVQLSSTEEKRQVKDCYFFLFNDILVGVKRGGLPKAMGGSGLAFLKGKVHAKYLWEIHNAVVSDVADDEGLKNCISLTIMGSSYKLSAESDDAKQLWISDITKTLAQIEKRKIFGIPLEELMRQTTEVGRDVPSFFENSLEFILANAIEEEGVFRLSGSANDIEKMRVKADQGLELNFYGIPYHNVTGIFKLFIRRMPSPIVTYELYDSVLAATKVEPRAEKIRHTKAALSQLPPYHKYLLQYLMYGLQKISQHVSKNKMTPYNLSIVFGPHVLKKHMSDPMAELTDSKTIYDSIQLMIEDHDAIFSDIAAERVAIRNKRAVQQLELVQKNQKVKQFKYDPTAVTQPAPTPAQQVDGEGEDDEDEENDAKLQGITISLKEIVKQGFLQKKGANRRNWTSRWFVLKHKYLFYFKNQKDQTPKGMISLVGVKIAPSDRKPYCWAISSANREYLICGKSQAEADEWMVAIKTCTTD